jgi:hypothetical protein
LGEDGIAQSGDRHVRACMLFSDRRVGYQGLCGDSNGAGEVFVGGIDALQHGCREQHLEGAAHGESLICTVACLFVCAYVEDSYAESAVVGVLQLREQGR